jgi:hypothetical protein
MSSGKRSRNIADALARNSLSATSNWIRACQVANQDRDVMKLEKEMDALADKIAEPWDDAPAG